MTIEKVVVIIVAVENKSATSDGREAAQVVKKVVSGAIKVLGLKTALDWIAKAFVYMTELFS